LTTVSTIFFVMGILLQVRDQLLVVDGQKAQVPIGLKRGIVACECD